MPYQISIMKFKAGDVDVTDFIVEYIGPTKKKPKHFTAWTQDKDAMAEAERKAKFVRSVSNDQERLADPNNEVYLFTVENELTLGFVKK